MGDLLTSVSTMLHCQIVRDLDRQQSQKPPRPLPYFEESTYTQTVPTESPSVRMVYSFLKHIFQMGQFNPECCIFFLVYINRLIGVTGKKRPLAAFFFSPVRTHHSRPSFSSTHKMFQYPISKTNQIVGEFICSCFSYIHTNRERINSKAHHGTNIIIINTQNNNNNLGIAFTLNNWKPITVTAIVVAQKMWDDTPLINSDFSILYPVLKVEQINYLERKFLSLLDFKITISPSLYSQYYFELRSILVESGATESAEALRLSHAKRIHLTEIYQKNKQFYKSHTTTTDDMTTSRAIRQVIC